MEAIHVSNAAERSDLGEIRIANEVVSIVAGLAATEVEGVAGMSGGIASGVAEMLGRKNLSKGVRVEVGEEQAADAFRSEEHTSELQSRENLVCRLLLEKKKQYKLFKY